MMKSVAIQNKPNKLDYIDPEFERNIDSIIDSNITNNNLKLLIHDFLKQYGLLFNDFVKQSLNKYLMEPECAESNI